MRIVVSGSKPYQSGVVIREHLSRRARTNYAIGSMRLNMFMKHFGAACHSSGWRIDPQLHMDNFMLRPSRIFEPQLQQCELVIGALLRQRRIERHLIATALITRNDCRNFALNVTAALKPGWWFLVPAAYTNTITDSQRFIKHSADPWQ